MRHPTATAIRSLANAENVVLLAFIDQALTEFSQAVLDTPSDEITNGTRKFISGENWHAIARHVLKTLAEAREPKKQRAA